jgi:hypothetical protein
VVGVGFGVGEEVNGVDVVGVGVGFGVGVGEDGPIQDLTLGNKKGLKNESKKKSLSLFVKALINTLNENERS